MAIVEVVSNRASPAPASPCRTVRGGRQAWLFLAAKVATTVAILILGCALMIVFPTSRADAQGCALCYQSAAASGAAGRAALRHGVVILLVPAISLFVGILALIYRRRNPPATRLCSRVRLPDLE
jgi:hypothetical protein